MRWLLCTLCFGVAASLCAVEVAEARGGKGGGGRPNWAGGGGGRPSWAGPAGGGGPKVSGARPTHAGGSLPQAAEFAKGKKARDAQSVLTDRGLTDGGLADGGGELLNPKQKQLLIEQRNRDKRLAQAQHLREIAERNGNANLAANADRMEAFAHEHYARRVAHWERFGVTDPALNPGGGVLDPRLPDGDPLGNLLDALLPILP